MKLEIKDFEDYACDAEISFETIVYVNGVRQDKKFRTDGLYIQDHIEVLNRNRMEINDYIGNVLRDQYEQALEDCRDMFNESLINNMRGK